MKYGISFWLIAIVLVTFGQQTDWTTYFEKHQYNGTPRYDETMEFCRRLAQNSPFISLDTVGISPQGRPIVVVIIDKNGHHTEESVRQSGNAVLLVQSAIHAGEPDGKDAMLQWLRDMVAYQKHVELLNHVTILWIQF